MKRATGKLLLLTLLIACISAHLRAQPVAGFTINFPTPVCKPATITFSNTSSGIEPLSYQWQFGTDPVFDTVQNPSYTFDTCGKFTVTLTVTDSLGLTDTAVHPVNVFCPLQSAFELSQSLTCDTALVTFTDITTGSPEGWIWTFGDPASGALDSSLLQNPSHHYASPGLYVASFTTISPAGCTATVYDSIQVPASPEPAFLISDSIVCAGDSVFFTDTSPAGDSIILWIYDFGDPLSGGANIDSTQHPSHVFSASGDYLVTLTVKTISGCENSSVKTVRVNPLPQAEAGTDQTICTGDTAQLNATGGISFHWNPATALSDSIIANPLAFPETSTTFFVQVTDTNGCTAVDSVTVHLQMVNADAGSDTSVCYGTSATLQASGGITYLWNPTASLSDSTSANPIASPLETTVYQVTVIDSIGCSAVDSVKVTVQLPVEITFEGLDSFYCANHEPVHLVASPEGGTFSGEGITENLFYPSVLLPDSLYYIIYSYEDSAGCSAGDSAAVFIHAIPVVTVTSAGDRVCANGAPIALETSPEGGMLSGNGISESAFDPSLVDSAGNYAIVYSYTDSNTCMNHDTVTITVLPLPEISISSDTLICEGDSVQLMAGGGIKYLWVPSDGLSSDTSAHPVAAPSATTEYFLTVTDTNDCSATDSVLISVFTDDAVDAGNDTSLCAGQSVMLQAAGGSSFIWSPSAGLSDTAIANPVATPLTTTTYTVTVSGGTCSAQDTVTITVFALPVVEAGADTFICSGTSIQLFVSGNAAWLWEPDSSLNDATAQAPLAFPVVSTMYFVTGTDNNGCSSRDSVFVDVQPLPAVTASNDTTVCKGDSVLLYAEGAVTFHWAPESVVSDPDSAVTYVHPDSTTWFEVTGIDTLGCAATDSVLITVYVSGNFIASDDTSVCSGDSVMLHAQGAESYSWSPGIFLNDSTLANPVATVIDTTAFVVTGTSQGCSGSDTITVNPLPLPVITASNDTGVCTGNSIQLFVSGGISYQWSPGVSLDDSLSANPVASPSETTLYHVAGTGLNGCSAGDSVWVTVHFPPVINITADTSLCTGETVLIIATGAQVYLWEPTTALSAPQNDSTFAFPSQTTVYTVFATDANECSNSASVTLTVHELPLVDAGPDQNLCLGVPVQLSASGGITYSWQPETGLSDPGISNPLANVSTDITYTVTATDAFNCSNRDSVALTVVPPLNATVSGDTTICAGTSAQLTAEGGSSYLWQPSTGLDDPLSATPLATPPITTRYTVFVSDGICDTDTLTTIVHVQPLPAVDAGADASVLSGAPYQIYASAADGTYEWTPADGLSCTGCLNPVATIFETTTYTLTVTTPPGCSASDQIMLTVICSEAAIYVPNAFTPNNNGHNDALYVRTLGDVDLNFFRVYDRWGSVIFETNNLNEGWNGTYNNKPMMPGAYLYEWEAVCNGGEVFRKQGNVTLLR